MALLPVTAFLLIIHLPTGSGQQQSYKEQPRDTAVVKGQVALLKCAINNRAGAVQWTKDGFALGFDPQIPGYPRYSMVGDNAFGEFNLRIESVSIEDDAQYQCQVGPTPTNKAIWANAHLSVLLPPVTVEIVDRPTGGTLEVRPQENLELTCLVKEGKPAATIKWYRRNSEIRIENEVYTVESVDGKRQNAKSKIRLHPSPDDNGAIYACEGNHPALPEPIRAQIKLSVLHAPGAPEIEGYQEGEVIRMGDSVTLTCVARGGNPLAQLVWYKNGLQVDRSYTTSGREAINALTFSVEASDNDATYKCESSNSVSHGSKDASVRMVVQFAPSKVTITGPKEAKVGDTVTIKCVTDRSNPAANVSWVVDGQPATGKSNVVEIPSGGWITSSDITIQISGQERSMMFSCYAVHHALGQTVVETFILGVLYPPNRPSIVGYTEGASIRAGNLQRLVCMAMGGNPVASLSWWKGQQLLKSTTSVNGNVASAEIAIVTEASDNSAEYRCEASNSATPKPLKTTIRLTIHFPPSGVSIKVSPRKAKSGRKVLLQCDSASSNPESIVTWWKDGYVVEGKHNGTFDGPHGGKSTRNILRLDVTASDDGAVYTCQATNEALQQSVHDAVTLDVQYKPEFVSAPTAPVGVLEGESTIVNLTARGNPGGIVYTWTRNGSPVPTSNVGGIKVFAAGPILNISAASRSDAGNYSVQAKNDEGNTIVTIVVAINYAAKVLKVSSTVIVDQGSSVQLECEAEGHPRPKGFYTWRREGYDLTTRTKQSEAAGRAYLAIYEAAKEDGGYFTCIANNGIGTPSEMKAALVVKFKPEMDTSPQYSKAAAEQGQSARLVCRARGAPNLTFAWARDGATLKVTSGTTTKYSMNSSQVDLLLWEGVLTVNSVRAGDYGDYECVVRNELGVSTNRITLDVTSHPDRPLALKILGMTHNTARLAWIPGFDGGRPQTFRIRYRNPGARVYLYTDVFPTNATMFNVTNLEVGTEYSFNVMAYNELGASDYTTESVKSTTLTEVPASERERVITQVLRGKGEVPRIVIITVSVVGTFLLVLNVSLVVCFIRRRRRKRLEDESSDQSGSKAATIEMYAPSSYNGTVTGETLSSISEKSETYSEENSAEDYALEGTKPSSATYLTDNGAFRPDTAGSHHGTPSRIPINLLDPDDYKYADALRKNPYNQTLGDKVGLPRSPPPHPPVRSASKDFYLPPGEARYISYPAPVPPQIQPTYTGTNTNTLGSLPLAPVLSTFNPQSAAAPPIPPLPNQDQSSDLMPEMQGHLV